MGQQLSKIFRCLWGSKGQALSNIVQRLWTSMGRTLSRIFRALLKIFRCLCGADDEEKSQSQHLLPLSRPDSSSWKRKSKPESSGCILIPPPSAVRRHEASADAIHYQCPSLPGSDSVSEPSPHCTMLIPPSSPDLHVAPISGTQSLLDEDLLKTDDGLQQDILVSLLRVKNDNLLSYDTNEVFSKTIEVVLQGKPVVSSPSEVKLKVPLKQNIGKGISTEERWINHYSSGQKILLVGEGDFSFSASLAMAFGTATNMAATSLNSKAFLKKNYTKAMSNIKILKERGCTLIHGVDATKMANHLLLSGMTFDCVIFNFPHAGFQKHESRKSELRRHRELINGFLGNAKEMIDEKGEIHITHKSNGFFLAWDLQRLASNHGLSLIEKVQFDVADYPGYGTKYGFGGDKCFNCNPSKTYKFGL